MVRVFEMVVPPEPGPEVTEVMDRDLDVWKRKEGGWQADRGIHPWAEIIEGYGPLTDVSPPPASPRTWALPDEPGPEVLRLNQPYEDGVRRWERTSYGNWKVMGGILATSWAQVLEHGPVTDATGEVWT